jgi:hypothetical protein
MMFESWVWIWALGMRKKMGFLGWDGCLGASGGSYGVLWWDDLKHRQDPRPEMWRYVDLVALGEDIPSENRVISL